MNKKTIITLLVVIMTIVSSTFLYFKLQPLKLESAPLANKKGATTTETNLNNQIVRENQVTKNDQVINTNNCQTEKGIIYSKESDISKNNCDLKYSSNDQLKNYCLKYSDIKKCSQESDQFLKDGCYNEVANMREDKCVCQNINENFAKYMCYGFVAERTQDLRTCYEIPIETASSKLPSGSNFDIKYDCFKRIQSINPRSNESLRNFNAIIEVSPNASMVERICKKYIHSYFSLYDLENLEVNQCGNYFSVFRPQLMDAPRIIIDRDGKEVGACGGMPGPSGESAFNEKCSIKCESENLCKGIYLDCASFDVSSKIPTDFDSQVNYYKKKMIYEYSGGNPVTDKVKCKKINNLRK